MATIDPRLNTSLPSGLDALDRQAQLDRGLEGALDTQALADVEQLRGPAVDAGEALLNAPAWDGGERTFETGDLQVRLSGADRGEAVDQGVDDVLAGLA